MLTLTVYKFIIVIILLAVPVVLGVGLSQKVNIPPKQQFYCKGNQCVSAEKCHNGDTCFKNKKCDSKCSGSGGSGVPLTTQGESTLQIVNSTSEDPLHVFVQTYDNAWTKKEGTGNIGTPVDWTTKPSRPAWNPLGSKKASEIILNKNEYIILNIPDDATYVMMPIKFRQKRTNFLTLKDHDDIKNIVYWEQYPILMEGGKDKVLDTSSVDGINFRLKMELTTDDGKTTQTFIKSNPCKEKLESGGCQNPVPKECGVEPSCQCCSATQKCKFNDCSSQFFDIPNDLAQKYTKSYDCGNPDMCCTRLLCDPNVCTKGCNETGENCKNCIRDGSCKPNDCCSLDFCPLECKNQCRNVGQCNNATKEQEPVKKFINNTANLKDNTDLKFYCDAIQGGNDVANGDFVTYCYDYNDLEASKYFKPPYKCKVEYFDLSLER